jgi:uncharacterized protein YjbI with pentapeptide repeats
MSDIKEEIQGINEAGQHLRVLELSFIAAYIYVGLAAASIRHTDLLLGKQLTLPLVQTPLNMWWFFVLAPIFLIVVHCYMLSNQLFLVRRIKHFRERALRDSSGNTTNGNGCLERKGEGPQERKLRLVIEGAGAVPPLPVPLVGLLLPFCHTNTKRRRIMLGLLLVLIAIVVPMATMVTLEYKFLPYRSLGVTTWQFVLIIFDIVFTFFSVRSLEKDLPAWQSVRAMRLMSWLPMLVIAAISVLLLAARLAEVRTREDATWFQRKAYKLSCIDLADAELVQNPPEPGDANRFGRRRDALLQAAGGADLYERNLECANLRRVVLVRADLRKANLQYANLELSDLRRSELEGANFSYSRLKGADLGGATGDGKTLFHKADMQSARLSGGSFCKTDFTEANLSRSRMEAGDFSQANFTGSQLTSSYFDGSNLDGAKLIGVMADGIKARGSYLRDADLFMARLAQAHLGAAELDVAEGLILRNADLRGVMADKVEFVDLASSNIWQLVLRENHLYAVDLRKAKAMYAREGEECEYVDASQAIAVFWKCQAGYIDRLFKGVGQRNGNQQNDEFQNLRDDRRQRMNQGPVPEAKMVCLSCGIEANFQGSSIAFEKGDQLAGKWVNSIDAGDVYQEIGGRVFEVACKDKDKALALIRELADCYKPKADIVRGSEFRRGATSAEKRVTGSGGRCLVVEILERHGLATLRDLEEPEKVDMVRRQICPAWSF